MIPRLIRAAAAAVLMCGVLVSAQTPAARRPEILLWGNAASTAADSSRFASVVKTTVAQHGFNVSFTTDPLDLNATNLAPYDALMLSGNDDALSADQKRAVFDFLKAGKGVIVDSGRPRSWIQAEAPSSARVSLPCGSACDSLNPRHFKGLHSS